MRAFAILIVMLLASPLILPGQSIPTAEPSAPSRNYHLLRGDDDWSFLPIRRSDRTDTIKYFCLRPDRHDWFLSMGGEARYVWEQIGKNNWGQQPFMNAHFNER